MWRLVAWAAVWGVLAPGCVEEGRVGGEPVHFYVSNQSFDQPSGSISLRIDGRLVFDRIAEVEGQHNWIPFDAFVSAGDHELRVLERDTGTWQTFSFTVTGEHWAVVDYWTGPSRFTFSFHDEPVAFD